MPEESSQRTVSGVARKEHTMTFSYADLMLTIIAICLVIGIVAGWNVV